MPNSSDFIATDERCYFRVGDVNRAFSLVVPDAQHVDELTAAWAAFHAEYLIEDRVVAMPKGFRYPRLDKRRSRPSGVPPNWELLSSLYGRRLIRFTDGLLQLIAASSLEARKRFDELGVDYGRRQIDDPEEMNRIIRFLRDP